MGGPSIGVDNLEKNLLSLLGLERQIAQPVRQSLDGGQSPAPAALPPGEECRYPLNRIMGGPSIGVDNLEKNLLSLLGFERQIAHPVRESLDGGQPPAPAVLPPGEECRYPLKRIMGGPSIGVDNLEKNLLSLLGFERQIAQPVRQ
jgi:hypothetical protein